MEELIPGNIALFDERDKVRGARSRNGD